MAGEVLPIPRDALRPLRQLAEPQQPLVAEAGRVAPPAPEPPQLPVKARCPSPGSVHEVQVAMGVPRGAPVCLVPQGDHPAVVPVGAWAGPDAVGSLGNVQLQPAVAERDGGRVVRVNRHALPNVQAPEAPDTFPQGVRSSEVVGGEVQVQGMPVLEEDRDMFPVAHMVSHDHFLVGAEAIVSSGPRNSAQKPDARSAKLLSAVVREEEPVGNCEVVA